MADSSLLPLDEKIRILSRLTVDIVERQIYKAATKINLSDNQMLILKILYTSQPRKVGELAEALNISKPAASKHVEYLVQKQLVSRKVEKEDRRSMAVSLLKKGNDIVDKYYAIHDKKIGTTLRAFDKKEQGLFNQLLDKYIANILSQEKNVALFCLECGGKYEGRCPVSEQHSGCYFKVDEEN